MKKMIAEIEGRISSTEREMKDIEHPEEKWERAVEEYHKACMDHAAAEIRLVMRIDELSAQLTKPLEMYAKKRGRYYQGEYQYEYAHPVAKELAELQDKLQSESRSCYKDACKSAMIRRREILENFNGVKTKLENDLEEDREHLGALLKLRDEKEAKKRPKKAAAAPCVHTVGITPTAEGYELNTEDLRKIAGNGVRDISFVTEEKILYMEKRKLREILRELPANVSVLLRADCVTFRWLNGSMRRDSFLNWRGESPYRGEVVINPFEKSERMVA